MSVRSDDSVPQRGRNVAELVELHAKMSPRRIAILSTRERVSRSYAELQHRIERLARGLLAAGLRPGDRLACWLGTSVAYIELYLAAARIEVVVVPVNERYVPDEAGFLIGDCDARALAFDASTAERAAHLDFDGTRIAAGCEPLSGRDLALEALLDSPAGTITHRSSSPDPIFALGYTSGTTGFPKGAILTHASVRAIARSNAISYHLTLGSVLIFANSMSFTSTVPAQIVSHMMVGGTVVITGRLSGSEMVTAVDAHQATYLSCPPPLVAELATAVAESGSRLTSLLAVMQSAGKGDPAALRRLNEATAGRLIIGYGMTENSGGLLAATRVKDMAAAATGGDPAIYESSGHAAAEAYLEVRGEDGQVLPNDGETVGELVAWSPCLAKGYWREPGKTAQAFREGLYFTGDLGSITPDGMVTIHARRSDLIVTGGMNVYPSEVERVLSELDGVAECAVFAVKHPRWGTSVGTAIVQTPGGALTAEDVVEYARTRLASFKKPTDVFFVDDIPKTTSGKVQRDKLAELSKP